MTSSVADLYAAAYLERHGREAFGRHYTVVEPGICGVVSPRDARRRAIRLLVFDDRACDRLAEHLSEAASGAVGVFGAASCCEALVRREAGWRPERPSTAMSLSDLRGVPTGALPRRLALRRVDRLSGEAPDAVQLEDAAALAIASDPGLVEDLDTFAQYLRGLPASAHLFAAVDEQGVVRATSGCEVFGDYARIFFVNTDPGWQRQGIGRAMTAEAIHAGAVSGARRMVLDATDAGTSVYEELGFEAVGRLTRFRRA